VAQRTLFIGLCAIDRGKTIAMPEKYKTFRYGTFFVSLTVLGWTIISVCRAD